MTFVYVPLTEPVTGAWVWLSLVIVPMVMVLIRFEHKPKVRRLLAWAVVALALAVALSASEGDILLPPVCGVCKNVEPWTQLWIACWLSGCV